MHQTGMPILTIFVCEIYFLTLNFLKNNNFVNIFHNIIKCNISIPDHWQISSTGIQIKLFWGAFLFYFLFYGPVISIYRDIIHWYLIYKHHFHTYSFVCSLYFHSSILLNSFNSLVLWSSHQQSYILSSKDVTMIGRLSITAN